MRSRMYWGFGRPMPARARGEPAVNWPAEGTKARPFALSSSAISSKRRPLGNASHVRRPLHFLAKRPLIKGQIIDLNNFLKLARCLLSPQQRSNLTRVMS